MPYVRVWIHFVWSTKNWQPLITQAIRPLLIAHVKQNAAKQAIWLDSLNAVVDHAHALISLGKDQTTARVMQLLKGESSRWVNQQNLLPLQLEWQEEYFAVSVSEDAVEAVRRYIQNQEEHHKKKLFSEEYAEFMREHGFGSSH